MQRLFPLKCKTPHFSIITGLPQKNVESRDITMRISFNTQAAQTRTGSRDTGLSCHLPISTLCCTVLSQSTNVTDGQTDRQTDGRHALSTLRKSHVESQSVLGQHSSFHAGCYVSLKLSESFAVVAACV